MALPGYLLLGMTEDQFWNGSPYLAVTYRKLGLERRKLKNEYLWIQGMYIHEAFSVVMQNAFRKKGSTPAKYSDKPYRITPMTEEEKKARVKAEREKAIASLNAWKSAWDNKNGRR